MSTVILSGDGWRIERDDEGDVYTVYQEHGVDAIAKELSLDAYGLLVAYEAAQERNAALEAGLRDAAKMQHGHHPTKGATFYECSWASCQAYAALLKEATP